MSARQRIAAALLTISAAGFAGWQASEGFTETHELAMRMFAYFRIGVSSAAATLQPLLSLA